MLVESHCWPTVSDVQKFSSGFPSLWDSDLWITGLHPCSSRNFTFVAAHCAHASSTTLPLASSVSPWYGSTHIRLLYSSITSLSLNNAEPGRLVLVKRSDRKAVTDACRGDSAVPWHDSGRVHLIMLGLKKVECLWGWVSTHCSTTYRITVSTHQS